jgi:hypothetical protein
MASKTEPSNATAADAPTQPKAEKTLLTASRAITAEEPHTDDRQKSGAAEVENDRITIQQILKIRLRRSLQAQESLTLAQLKQRARQKAAGARSSKPVPPKRKKRRIYGGKKKKNKPAPPSDPVDEAPLLEPADQVEMNTGTLYLYRGENPRVKFHRRK